MEFITKYKVYRELIDTKQHVQSRKDEQIRQSGICSKDSE